MSDLQCVLCGTKANDVGDDVDSLHMLPQLKHLRSKWVSFIQLFLGDDWSPGDKTSLCSQHFKPSDFTKAYGKKQLVLKSLSHPCIHTTSTFLEEPQESTPVLLDELSGCVPGLASEHMEVDEVDIPEGTSHPFLFGDDVKLVHVLVENSTELHVRSLYSVTDFDDFLASDKDRFLLKILKNYKLGIANLEKQPKPLTESDHWQLSELKNDLGAVKEKLAQWAAVAIEQGLTVANAGPQKASNFDRAEFLMFKSLEQLQSEPLKQRDEKIKKLKFELRLKKDLERVARRDCKYAVAKNKELVRKFQEGGQDKAAKETIAKLRAQLDEALKKEKKTAATVAQMKASAELSATEIEKHKISFSQVHQQLEVQKKVTLQREARIGSLIKQLSVKDAAVKALVAENAALKTKLGQPNHGVVFKRTLQQVPSPTSVPKVAAILKEPAQRPILPAPLVQEQVPVIEGFSLCDQVDQVLLIHVD